MPQKISKQNNRRTITFSDLFAGIGGIRYGFEAIGAKCVFTSEIDLDCRKTYLLNFGEYPNGDITKITTSTIPDHDILTAGFPCQPFSICGKRKGFEDTRGTLFFNILQIAKDKKPNVVFLENVKHFKYHNGGKTLKTVLHHLEFLGFKTEWAVLNGKDFGTAQNRERIIIVGNKQKRFDFSKLKTKSPLAIKDILQKDGDFDFLERGSYTLIKNPVKQKSGLIFVGYRNKKIRISGTRRDTKHLSRVHKQPNRIYSSEGTHPTLPSQESSGRFFILHGGKVRKITVGECLALMGFPKKFKRFNQNGKLYRQIGNSVCVPMISELARQIKLQYFAV